MKERGSSPGNDNILRPLNACLQNARNCSGGKIKRTRKSGYARMKELGCASAVIRNNGENQSIMFNKTH